MTEPRPRPTPGLRRARLPAARPPATSSCASTTPARARALLAEVIPRGDHRRALGRQARVRHQRRAQLRGPAALGLPGDVARRLPAEFRAGMAPRAELLGDVGDSAPEHWEAPFGRGEVARAGDGQRAGPARAGRARPALREAIARPGGVTVVVSRPAPRCRAAASTSATPTASPSRRSRAAASTRPGPGAPLKDGGWRPIRAGEFILGYPDEENALPAAPPPDQLGRNGSYLVYRKLRQDVARFRRTLREAAALTRAARSSWRPSSSGAGATARRSTSPPIARTRRRSPTRPATTPSTTLDDPGGLRCPIGRTSAA